jgi:hypothetical protein
MSRLGVAVVGQATMIFIASCVFYICLLFPRVLGIAGPDCNATHNREGIPYMMPEPVDIRWTSYPLAGTVPPERSLHYGAVKDGMNPTYLVYGGGSCFSFMVFPSPI